MRIPALLVVLVAAATLAGCETEIDGKKAETSISATVEDRTGADVQSVECPAGLVAKKGETFTCTVTGADGSTGEAKVLMKDDDGNVNITTPFITVASFTQSISDSLVTKTGADPATLTVTCPQIITAKKGVTLRCEAKLGDQSMTLDVTQTDNKGSISIEEAK